jgi:transcriptional regulator with XRE-family HTH domain
LCYIWYHSPHLQDNKAKDGQRRLFIDHGWCNRGTHSKLRRRKGVTQVELAKALGVSQRGVSYTDELKPIRSLQQKMRLVSKLPQGDQRYLVRTIEMLAQKHGVNDKRIDAFNAINFQNGYELVIDITTPHRFLLDAEQENI